jgi:glycosyltransferase involved in cell wall biosynthesis
MPRPPSSVSAPTDRHEGPEFVILNQYYVPDVASTGHLLAELAHESACLGRSVSVITSFPCYGPPETWQPCEAFEQREGVTVRRMRTTRFRKDSLLGRVSNSVTFLVPLAMRMLLSRAKGRVFMYTSNPPFLGIIGGLVSIVRPHPYVVLLHDSYPHLAVWVGKFRSGSLVERAWHMVNRLLYGRARQTIVLCERAKELVVREYGIPPERVQVVHNWADPKALFPIPKSASAFAKSNGYDQTFTVLYSGNLGLYYEFDTILEAARRLQDDPGFRLVFVGAGGKRQQIADRIAELGLRNVDMHQYQPFERLNDSLNACDASLVTIARGIEGISFPSKLYSSLAVGKPVLAISEPGGELEGMVRDAGAGLWSPVGDVDALVANIKALRADADAARRMGDRARSLMEERYTIQAAAREYLRVIDRAAEEVP